MIFTLICSWGWLGVLTYIQLQLSLTLDLWLVGRWTWHLALQLDQKMQLHCNYIQVPYGSIFFTVHSRTILLSGPTPVVGPTLRFLCLMQRSVCISLSQSYTQHFRMQSAFADGSTDGALRVSQCMDRMFLNSSFLFCSLLISIFTSHCMSFNILLSKKWSYLNSHGKISCTCRN